MAAEKRQYPRLPATLEAQYLLRGSQQWQTIRLHNLSAGGIGLLVEEDDAGDISGLERVRFRLPPDDHEFELAGEVVGCRDTAGEVVAGIRFIDPDLPTIDAIQQYVFEQLIAQSAELLHGKDNPKRVECAEPIRIQYEHFTRFVDEVMENLSLTGMFIRSDAPHPPGTTFDFAFQLDDDLALIHGRAEVVWTREVGGASGLPCGMGVRFVDLTGESRELISRIVNQRNEEPDEDCEETTGASEPGSGVEAAGSPAVAVSAKKLLRRLDRLRKKAKEREQEYRSKIERAAHALAATRVRMQAMETESLELQSEIERERVAHAEEVETLRANRDRLAEDLAKVESERDRVAADLDSEREISQALTTEKLEADRRRESIEADLGAERDRTKALGEELKGLRSQLADPRRTAPDVNDDEQLASLRARLAEVETSLSASETARTQIKIANTETHRKVRTAQKARREAEKERDKLRQELADAHGRLEAAEAAVRSSAQDLAPPLPTDGADHLAAHSALHPDAGAEELAAALAATQAELERARSQADAQLKAAAAELEELRGSLSTSEAARRQIAHEASAARAQQDALHKQLMQIQRRGASADDEATRTEMSLRSLGARLSARQIELEAAMSERDALEDDLNAQKQRLAEAQHQSRKWPLRAAALVAAGTFVGILTGSVLIPGAAGRGPTLPHDAEAATAGTTQAVVASTLTTSVPALVDGAQAVAQLDEARDPGDPVISSEPSPSITEAVQDWANAWSLQDVERYLDAYDADFAPPGGMTRAAWRAQRRDRLQRPAWIRIEVADIVPTELAGGLGRATFLQKYQTPTYRDEVEKTLELVRRDGHWKIVQETSSS